MSTTYRAAAEVAEIAEKLIDSVHFDLVGVRIEYLFRDKAKSGHGRTIWATASKVGGRNAILASGASDEEQPQDPKSHEFFVLEVAEDIWRWLTEGQRLALVDHELMHMRCDIDEETGKPILSTRGHDLEEFRSIIDRHGFWKDDVAEMAATVTRKAKQLAFDPEAIR
jgi:hypothetical protein